MTGSTYAVVIAVERYQRADINAVEYAAADAMDIATTLEARLGVPTDNISVWIDQNANRTTLENDLPYLIRQLGNADRFVFFYAGHGFHANGSNRLTAWDTHPSSLAETTVCIEQVLLKPLRESRCRRSLVFIDACASSFSDISGFSRDMLASLDRREFDEYVRANEYAAAFFSCSPTEKSYSSPALKHGIWTYHLLEALNGRAREAIHREDCVTGDSLKEYLGRSVRKYIREKTDIRGQQKPLAMIGSTGAFEIVRIPAAQSVPTALPTIVPKFGQAYLLGRETRPYGSIEGFNRSRHKVPTSFSDSANFWAGRLLHAEMVAELEEVYRNAKAKLGLKRREINFEKDDSNGGSLDCDLFRFAIFAGQNQEDHEEAVIERHLVLRVPANQLPDDFGSIFSAAIDHLVLPFSARRGAYDKLVDALEDMDVGDIDDSPSTQTVTLSLEDGVTIVFDMVTEKMVFSVAGQSDCLALMFAVRNDSAAALLGTIPPLLGGPDA